MCCISMYSFLMERIILKGIEIQVSQLPPPLTSMLCDAMYLSIEMCQI